MGSVEFDKKFFLKFFVSTIIVFVVTVSGFVLVSSFLRNDDGFTIDSVQDFSEPVSVIEENVSDSADAEHIGVDLLGNEVSDVDRERTEMMNQVSNTGTDVLLPSLNASFSLGALDVVDGNIEPTNYTSVFEVRNVGVKYDNTDSGTTYLVAHALDSIPGTSRLAGVSPGNFFFDYYSKQSTLHPGDKLVVGGVEFVYEYSETIVKKEIGLNDYLWDSSVPHRVVFITCLSDSDLNFVSYFRKV